MRIKSPLFSLSAHGTVGNILTFSLRKSGQKCRYQRKQKDKITTARTIARNIFIAGKDAWNLLNDNEKAEYNENAKSLNLTGYNLFIKEYIESHGGTPQTATFGTDPESPQGATGYDWNDRIMGSEFVIPRNGTAQSISFYVFVDDAFTTKRCKCAIYKTSDGSFVAESEEKTLTFGSFVPAFWETFDFSDPKPNLLKDESYTLVILSESGCLLYPMVDYPQSSKGKVYNSSYNGFPTPISFNSNDFLFNVYVTYEY